MNIKSYCISALMAAIAITVQARGTWTIDGLKYTVDTLYHATAGPGTTEIHLRVTNPTTGKYNNLFYTTVELATPYVEMRAAKAGNALRAVETVPQIAERFSKPDEIYFAGTNADFFNTGFPYNALGATITNGSLANLNTTGESADIDDYFIYFDADGIPDFARHVVPAQQGSVEFPDGNGYIHYVNKSRGTNELIIYTPQWQFYDSQTKKYYQQGHTGTNKWGTEVVVRPVGANILYGKTMQLEVVDNPQTGIGDMAIPENCYVLSGHGSASDYMKTLKKGDIIKEFIAIRADGKDKAIKELIGGFPFILRSGMIQSTPSYPDHLSNPEPRTAVGYNWDKSLLTMLVVDGRNAGGSAGVTQKLLAQFMYKLGCLDAMNFDGGGSSTLYINRLGVRNIPSISSLDKDRKEGEPRVVVNGLFAVATAPVDNTIESIEIREKRLDLKTGETYTPTVYGYNRYGVLVDPNVKGYTIAVASQIGTLSGSTLTAGSGNYRGDLTVTLGSSSYSIPVFVNGNDGQYVNSGINIIEADPDYSAPVEYYTPLGQRITHPQPGQIVIERRGSKVTRYIYR